MGHKISKEMIDPGVKDHIMSFVGDVADLETEVNTDIISAVNSLIADRVDNEENIGKLANAIGEPVTASDSVDEVVTGLGELLSTFKTNMMNSGVTVESGDKFKSLIDKIKGLTEGEGNKGIRYAEGSATQVSLGTITTDGIHVNVDFEPTLVFVEFRNRTTPSYTSSSYNTEGFVGVLAVHATDDGTPWCINFGASLYAGNSSSYYYRVYFNKGLTSDNLITIEKTETASSWIYGTPATDYTWYVIGVGEEDTTLRDSLASILEGKGVEVTEEDDMASLISKVDGIQSGGLDIISATELPSSGKENQICVITDNPTDAIIISPDSSDQVTGSIYCNISPNPGNVVYNVTSGNMIAKYNMLFFAQDGSTLSSYIYQNGAWTQFTNDRQFFMKDIAFTDNAIFGGYCTEEFTSVGYGPFYSAGQYFYARNWSSFYTAFVSSNNKINFDNFSHAAVELYAHDDNDEVASGCPGKVFVASTEDAVFGSYMSDYIDDDYVTTLIITSEKLDYDSDGVSRYYEFDLTSWTGEGHFTLFFGHTTYCPYTYIKNIYLY